MVYQLDLRHVIVPHLDDDGDIVLDFGTKHKGDKLRDVKDGYLKYICENDFPDDLIRACQMERKRR